MERDSRIVAWLRSLSHREADQGQRDNEDAFVEHVSGLKVKWEISRLSCRNLIVEALNEVVLDTNRSV